MNIFLHVLYWTDPSALKKNNNYDHLLPLYVGGGDPNGSGYNT